MSDRTAVIVGGNRTPFAKIGGPYAHASSRDLLIAAIDGLVARFGLAGETVGEVAAGAVLRHTRDFNLTREAVLGSALAPETPAVDLAQACATGFETVTYVANKIRAGQVDVGIAGGVDSASDAPMAANEGLRRALLRLNAARTLQDRLLALTALRPGHVVPEAPVVREPRTGLSMGEHQAVTTKAWRITREAQDELAAASHHNLAATWASGFFDDLVTAYLGLATDGLLRADTSTQKLAKLPPVFGDGPEATMTAGNSTALTDGAAVVLVAEEGYARRRNWPVLARIVDVEVAAVDFVSGAEGLLMAPAYAVPKLLDRQGLGLGDLTYVEIHEAFAATVLSILAAWSDDEFCRTRLGREGAYGTVDRDRLNVTGSSLATGHPFAATGARIAATLAKLLHRSGPGSRGLLSICAAGGQGVAAVLEGM
ncbi:acetyl-CoA C-acetyltransferase [Propionicicella superfundia]|uniref:acetyl-CoA C-acetyltransferase n=1 Tax=Propionicicella superfundia TaxID=348582 RepID=UPI000418BA48|nr:acetyl-CoA C-acetyltransferase [Propionicicella superfundia]